MAGGGAVGIGGGFGEEGEEFGGNVGGEVGGGFRRRLPFRGLSLWGGAEVHDPFAADEDAEEFAGDFVDDLEAAAFGGAEVEEGVAEGEVEDVAAGEVEFVADGRRFGHFYNLVQGLTRIRQSGSFCRVL